METVSVKKNHTQERIPFVKVIEGKRKKSFEEACAECNAVPLDRFIDELKASVKEYFDHA